MINKYIILISIFGLGCSSLKNEIKDHRKMSNFISIHFDSYRSIHNEIKVEIDSMIILKLKTVLGQIGHEYKIDELILFNSHKTKLFTTINTNYKEYKGLNDLVQALYGVKINDKWHIYLGSTCVAMREAYKYEIYEPFTWEELSFVAHDNFFGKFIDFDWKGNLMVDSDKIDKQINPRDLGGTDYLNEGSEEAGFMKLSKYYEEETLSSAEYNDLLNEVTNPAPKVKDPIIRLTWWDKLWGAKEPIFETDEWKDYIKSKNKKK